MEAGIAASGNFIFKHGKYVAKKLPFIGTAIGAAYLYNSNNYSLKNITYNLIPGADIVIDVYEALTGKTNQEPIPIWNVNHAIQLKVHVNNEQNYEFALSHIFGYYDIDPEAGKPKIIYTPIPPKVDGLESFPINDDEFKLPGFETAEINVDNNIESFPIHEYGFGDFILTMSSKLSDKEKKEHIATVNDIITAL